MRAGEFTGTIRRSRPARPAAGQPLGTLSQEVYYFDRAGVEVARVHQYLLADGSLGAGGKPDPKSLFLNGVRYHLHRGPLVKQDPSARFPEGSARRRAYIVWRRVKCALMGR